MNSLKHTAPPDTKNIFTVALRHHKAGRLEEADKLYRQILSVEPNHADSLHLLGTIGHRIGQHDAAIALILQAIRARNDVPAYYNNLANVLKDKGRRDEAVQHYTHALSLNPDYAEAHYNLGATLHEQGKLKEASAHYERAIALQPTLIAAYNNLGNALKDQGRLDEAVTIYERALAINPNDAAAHYNLGSALKDQGKLSDALRHYECSLALDPKSVKAHNNLGVLLRTQGQLEAAMQHFQKATSIKPDHAESHLNEAMILLLSGNMAAGWSKYEWRWRMNGKKPFESDKPLWNGNDLQGKTILLHGEQGLGDCIQFVRYASMVKGRGGRILLKCPSALSRLFKSMDSIDQIPTESGAVPDYDCHAPLMSLPMIFGATLDTIPNSVPYLFAPLDQISIWAERLRPQTGFKIGLVWAGNSQPDHPAADAIDLRRSMNLAQFAPLMDIPGIRFFSLQKGDAARQLELLPQGVTVTDYMDHVQDFADTAALTANLDLVIGVDTSVIHLAGAMSKPVWVLSRFDGCWRWLQDREDSPWYPTLRLFRQPRMGDWQSVIQNVRQALMQLTNLSLYRAG